MPPAIQSEVSRIPLETEWLRANAPWEKPAGVDREAGVIRGMVGAELGYFKSEGRGQFTAESLAKIVELGNKTPKGLKSRFTHPGLSSDGLGSVLGRGQNWRLNATGTKALYDLEFNKTALNAPPGGGTPKGAYVMDLAESDKGLFGSSLVLKCDKSYTLDENGRPKKDADGNEIPPIWMPTELKAIDIVDDGDAVHGDALGVEGLADANVRQAAAALDAQFSGCSAEVIQARANSFLDKYLAHRFGDSYMANKPEAPAEPKPVGPKTPATPATPQTPTPAQPAPTQPRERAELSGDDEAAKRAALKAELLGELSGVKEEIATAHAALKADLAAAAEANKLATAEALKTRIEDFLTSRLPQNGRPGKVQPWELDESDKESAHLSLRQRMLLLSAERTIKVGDKMLSPLDIEMAAIDAREVQVNRERLSANGSPTNRMSPERKKELYQHYTYVPMEPSKN